MTRERFYETFLEHLHAEVEHELKRRANPGGMQVGVPRMVGASHGLLRELERDIRHCLTAEPEWVDRVEEPSR